MRFKIIKLFAFLIISLNTIGLYWIWNFFHRIGTPITITNEVTKTPNKHLSKLITVIIRQFETYENDVSATVESILTLFPHIHIYIICDDIPYPPLNILYGNGTSKQVHLLNLGLSLGVPLKDRLPSLSISTKYALFIPDSTRIPSRQVVQAMVNEVIKHPGDLCAALYANDKSPSCLGVEVNIREWSLKYSKMDEEGKVCDAVVGKHAILVEATVLRKLTEPFMLPFPETLYIQTAVLKTKVSSSLSFW